MRKEREKEGSYVGGWIEVKSMLATMLIMGFILIVAESLFRYNRPTCSAIQPGISNMRTVDQPLLPGRENQRVQASQSTSQQQRFEGKRQETTATVVGGEQAKTVQQGKDEDVTRQFRPYGSAASLFVEFGSYRGGPNTFAVVGLASKPLHVFGKPGFRCEWVPSSSSNSSFPTQGKAEKMLPDWGYGRVYTVVVVNCTFAEAVGIDSKGGELILHASRGGDESEGDGGVRFVALTEKEGEYRASAYEAPYRYDFVYCGSSLFGSLNAERVREWMAWHVKLMGRRSHFVFHDAGGLSGVRRVLQPWQKLGYVTVYDIQQQRQYDGYYYNQFLIVNDCLHRTRFLANWTFFFDVDEYLYVPPQDTLQSVMQSFSNYTQITYEQSPMSPKLCQNPNLLKQRSHAREWGFEKLIYRNVKRGVRWDRKYAVQARSVFATGVHMSENVMGKTLHTRGPKIKYYHFHDTITQQGELCQELVNTTSTRAIVYSDKDPFKLDTGLQYLAQAVKDFELQQIGPLLIP